MFHKKYKGIKIRDQPNLFNWLSGKALKLLPPDVTFKAKMQRCRFLVCVHLSVRLSVQMEFNTETELKRGIMTESLLNKYDILRKSPEVPVKRSPKVVRKVRALALYAPWDSIKIGWKKIYELVRLVYFAILRLAARYSAADWAEDGKYEAASVLATVTSQVKGLPPCHGINVRPSGLLPSSDIGCVLLMSDYYYYVRLLQVVSNS